MTNFEKMKYLHRNAGKSSGAEAAEKKDTKKVAGTKTAGKKKAAQHSETEAGEKEGMPDEK